MSKKLSLEPYKGVRDFYPEDQAFLNYFMETCRSLAQRVGYVEYGASILEPTELYRGKTSEEIMNDQTYTFLDRGEREVTLRPEMTPTVARMVAAKRRELGFPLRLFSIPNIFRYERPQRGRLREHWQFNADLFGSTSLAADAEIIAVAYGLMRMFGATESDFVIKLGSRTWLDDVTKDLDNKKKRAFYQCLDARGKLDAAAFKAKLDEIGVSEEILSAPPSPEITKMLTDFNEAGIHNIVWDPSIVRGFDYYTGIVFEVFDTHPDNNRALFGGGRYDNLLSLFGEDVPAVGVACGDVTIHDFLSVRGLLPSYVPPTHVYIAITDPSLATSANTFAGRYLRPQGVSVAIDFGEKKLADQIKTAVKHKIPYLIVLGENELTSGSVVVRDLATGEEKPFTKELLAEFFLNLSKEK